MFKFFLSCSLFLTITGSLLSYELSITAIFQNEAPYLKEWIEYHRMVGVEHFWLYNDGSTDNWAEVLAPYISQGVVEVMDWASPDTASFIKYQLMSYKDALNKAKGVSKWLALIDVDEFILPAEESTITACLEKNFSQAAGIYVNWHMFGTGGVYLKEGQSQLFRLTACSKKYHPMNSVGKSIVRPDCVQLDEVWNCHHFVMQPNKHYCDGDGQQLSFVNLDLKLDGTVHNKFIRINHYRMRDENFFKSVRLERTLRYGLPVWQLWEHYHAYNEEQDRSIIKFIRQKHPKEFEKWKGMFNVMRSGLDIQELHCQKEPAVRLKQRRR